MYADYQFYTEDYFGSSIAEADFPRLSSRASDFLDYYTRGKAVDVEESTTLTALKKACCAVAEAMKENEDRQKLAERATQAALSESGGEVKSETVGSHSASYTTAADYASANTVDARKAQMAMYASVAAQYLVNTGLLYRGGCCS
jgi:hypothetical protein